MGQSRDKEREQGRGSGSDGVVSGGFRSWRHRDAKLQQSGRGVYTRESGRAVVARQWLGPGWGSCIKQIQTFSWEEK
ncbi:hypothetical protein JHK82_029273 [Glycine max]|nr:hypothetical protein JHK86_029385 [Glycine max]KAG5128438.1 hypothetical protein JHK82_029273 [Glycine max]